MAPESRSVYSSDDPSLAARCLVIIEMYPMFDIYIKYFKSTTILTV